MYVTTCTRMSGSFVSNEFNPDKGSTTSWFMFDVKVCTCRGWLLLKFGRVSPISIWERNSHVSVSVGTNGTKRGTVSDYHLALGWRPRVLHHECELNWWSDGPRPEGFLDNGRHVKFILHLTTYTCYSTVPEMQRSSEPSDLGEGHVCTFNQSAAWSDLEVRLKPGVKVHWEPVTLRASARPHGLVSRLKPKICI